MFDTAKVEKYFTKMKKYFDNSKISGFFVALKLTKPASFRVFIATAFFIAVHQNSLCCCIPSDSRCETLLTLACQGTTAFFNNLIFNPTMPASVKIERSVKHSSAAITSHSTKTVTVGKPAEITFILTGKRGNRYLHALSTAIHELLIEETRGFLFAEKRFEKKYEAANLLFPNERRSLRGLTVKIA